jgi:hypothetical protein
VDAVAPALIGLGIWFMYEAWKTPAGSAPTPIASIKSALQGSGSLLGGAAGSSSPNVTPTAAGYEYGLPVLNATSGSIGPQGAVGPGTTTGAIGPQGAVGPGTTTGAIGPQGFVG